ncbi:hypothetical protein [Frankia sp. Cppng1_Ct_nod]|uniref:hypothetical protein n=1 Tax=Frankia sp. Cppng1_Ct_nod TaxID=2897162 RepID=UPI0013EF9D30|nr:hypothetical protein [Frankia sp. Cppng1_Ct_nod]
MRRCRYPGFYPLDDGVDYPEDVRLERIARLTAELRVPGRSFTSAWDREFLTGLAGTDDSWLAEVGRDITTRADNAGHEALGWVAAWAAAGQSLTTLAYEFNPQWSAGSAVAGSAWAFAPEVRTAIT